VRPGGPAVGALRPYDRLLQVNNVRTKDLDCCQVVPLIVQVTGKEVHLVISRNPLVWGSTTDVRDLTGSSCSQKMMLQQQRDPTATIVRSKPSLHDGDRGSVR
jgi:C-terminal processing protease CtpA/Prc